MFDQGCKAANDLSIEKWPYTSQTSINFLTYTVEGSSDLYYFGGNPHGQDDMCQSVLL